jgi:hypothetical protein
MARNRLVQSEPGPDPEQWDRWLSTHRSVKPVPLQHLAMGRYLSLRVWQHLEQILQCHRCPRSMKLLMAKLEHSRITYMTTDITLFMVRNRTKILTT